MRQLNQDVADRIEEAAAGRYEPEPTRPSYSALDMPASRSFSDEDHRPRQIGPDDYELGRLTDSDDDEQPWRPEPVTVRHSLEESTVILPLVRPRHEDDTVVLYFPSGIFDED
jgi:hypothetical protein